jgi:4-diphosphocytidyl-2C-methyl-D-erythritol kinase
VNRALEPGWSVFDVQVTVAQTVAYGNGGGNELSNLASRSDYEYVKPCGGATNAYYAKFSASGTSSGTTAASSAAASSNSISTAAAAPTNIKQPSFGTIVEPASALLLTVLTFLI